MSFEYKWFKFFYSLNTVIGEDYAEEPMIHPTLILKRYQQIIGRGLYDKKEREDEYKKIGKFLEVEFNSLNQNSNKID